MRVAGIMSGTSLDGIDVAVIEVRGRGWAKRVETLAASSRPYPKQVRQALLEISNAQTHTAYISRLNFLLAELYAEALISCCQEHKIPLSSIELIGSHGQTIFHEGERVRYLGRSVASTLQIGDGSVLAERTGIPTVTDFRTADMAAGGKGAPLVPYVDYLLFRHARLGRVALNIGGIANVTAIPPGAGPESVIAFDTGPGNMVMDGLVSRFTGGRKTFDKDGKLAARGKVNKEVLERLCRDSFYRKVPPKTAGREQYGAEFLKAFGGLSMPDAVATATALTAATIGYAIDRFIRPRMPVDELIVSGGGARNPLLMAYLASYGRGVSIRTSSEYGIDSDAKEAIAFAILAYETLHKQPSNLPAATGARHPAILGKLSLTNSRGQELYSKHSG